jgi:acylphosphatase
MAEAIVRKRVLVSGRVQGVWFRASTQATAQRHRVTGSVSNLPDGRVEAVFQGFPEHVEACIAWCRTGPPGARVTGVETSDEPVVSGERGFEIA